MISSVAAAAVYSLIGIISFRHVSRVTENRDHSHSVVIAFLMLSERVSSTIDNLPLFVFEELYFCFPSIFLWSSVTVLLPSASWIYILTFLYLRPHPSRSLISPTPYSHRSQDRSSIAGLSALCQSNGSFRGILSSLHTSCQLEAWSHSPAPWMWCVENKHRLNISWLDFFDLLTRPTTLCWCHWRPSYPMHHLVSFSIQAHNIIFAVSTSRPLLYRRIPCFSYLEPWILVLRVVLFSLLFLFVSRQEDWILMQWFRFAGSLSLLTLNHVRGQILAPIFSPQGILCTHRG
jgi:hypothetical protein